MDDIIRRIKDTREDNDETQAELCKALKINRVQWTKYENGINELPIRYLIAFCKHYKISSDYILGLPAGLERPR